MILKTIFGAGAADDGAGGGSTSPGTASEPAPDGAAAPDGEPAHDSTGVESDTGPTRPPGTDDQDPPTGIADQPDDVAADVDPHIEADSETTSKVAAEAEQGTGPAAASATTSATGATGTDVSSVSVVVGEHGASAASDVGVVAVGPNGAAAANEVGVVAVGPEGGASASESANAADVTMRPGRDADDADRPDRADGSPLDGERSGDGADGDGNGTGRTETADDPRPGAADDANGSD